MVASLHSRSPSAALHLPLYLTLAAAACCRGGCAADWPDLYPDFSAGKLMRLSVVKGIKALPHALTGLGKRTRVGCACDICSKSLTHAALMKQLASSIFCPVIPGDTQVGGWGCGMQAWGSRGWLAGDECSSVDGFELQLPEAVAEAGCTLRCVVRQAGPGACIRGRFTPLGNSPALQAGQGIGDRIA